MARKSLKGVPIFDRKPVVSIKHEIPADKDLIVKGAVEELPADHWCEGCAWATRLTDRYMCPFVYGSCVRLPHSIENPNQDILHSRIRYDRIYTDAHREVFDNVCGY